MRVQQANSILTVSDTQVSSGDTVTISWEGRGTDMCTISGPDGFREQSNKGSVTGKMLQTSEFILNCSVGQRALPEKRVTIEVI